MKSTLKFFNNLTTILQKCTVFIVIFDLRVGSGFSIGFRAISGRAIFRIFGSRADLKSLGSGRVDGPFLTRLALNKEYIV